MAASVLQKGTEALTHSSSQEERAFHRALAELRRRWRVRRNPTGAIVGDLGYSSGKTKKTLPHLAVHVSWNRDLSIIYHGAMLV